MKRQVVLWLAILVLGASSWMNFGGSVGSQEAPGQWRGAGRLDSGCDPQEDPEAPETCAGHGAHAAAALDRFDCRLGGVPADGYPCGKVLIAGGLAGLPDADPNTAIDNSNLAKIYDPVNNRWKQAAPMGAVRGAVRQFPAAVLLDGPRCRVPANIPDYCGDVLVVGGNNLPPLPRELENATSEVYDPPSNTWEEKKDLPGLFRSPVAVLLDGPGCADKCGMVLVIGWQTNIAALYDPANKLWLPTAGPIFPRDGGYATAVLLSGPGCADKCGNVLLAGGQTASTGEMDEAELYVPAQGAWVPTGSMINGRYEHSASLLTGLHCEIPSPPEWCGNVLVVGGKTEEQNSQYDSAERYRPEQGDWVSASTTSNKMSARREFPSITSLPDGRVLVVGGMNDSPAEQDHVQSSGDVYDPVRGHWTSALKPEFGPESETEPSYRRFHTATRLPAGPAAGCGVACGAVFIAGGTGFPSGADEDFGNSATAEIFFPSPVVSKVVPPVCGETEVVLRGAGFASTTSLTLDGVPAQSLQIHPQLTDSEIQAVSSHGPVGTQAVTVTTTGGTSAPRSISYPSPPAIASLAPDRGPVVGGTPVTITGTDLGRVSEVKFGSQPAAGFQVLSDTQISAVSPSHLTAETVDVSVKVENCTSRRPFTYFTLPLPPVDPGGPVAGGAGTPQNSTIVNGGGPASPPGSQQSVGGTAPPSTPSGPPPSGPAPAVLTAPAPAPFPGPVAGQAGAPTLVSGDSMVPSVEAAAPSAAMTTASVAPEEEPAPRYGMVRSNQVSRGTAVAMSSMTLGSLILIGCCASVQRKGEQRPGAQGAY